MVKGTVSITLEDFQSMVDAKLQAEDRIEKTNLASKELQVFLSFLCTRIDIKPFVDQFNEQSRTSNIIIEGGRAKIKNKNE